MRDIASAASEAAELVSRGRVQFDADFVAKRAAEAIIGRIGDACDKLPAELRSSTPTVPWDQIYAMRIHVDHVYHRLDPNILWDTLAISIPALAAALAPGHAGDRPVVVERAVSPLGAEELGTEYAKAWEEWPGKEAETWDGAAADGIARGLRDAPGRRGVGRARSRPSGSIPTGAGAPSNPEALRLRR